jgi:stringent starvation protein B
MSKYEYQLMPRTYKTALRILDEFYEWCTENKLNPTIIRYNAYILKKQRGEL